MMPGNESGRSGLGMRQEMSRNDVTLGILTSLMPLSMVPVMTVPWPLMGKQWSTEKMNGPLGDREGMNTCRESTCAKRNVFMSLVGMCIRQTGGQTDRQTDRQTDERTDKQVDRQTDDRQADR